LILVRSENYDPVQTTPHARRLLAKGGLIRRYGSVEYKLGCKAHTEEVMVRKRALAIIAC
jgi:hypothetical protein